MNSKKGFTVLEIIIVAAFASLAFILFFIQKSNEFKSSIWVEKNDRRINAKSLLGILSLGIIKGTQIKVIADGVDEEAAVSSLINLIENELTD